MSTGRNQMSSLVTKSPAARVRKVEPCVSTVLQRHALCLVFGQIQAPLNGKGPALVDDGSAGEAIADIPLVPHWLEIAVSVRIVQGSVLAEALDQICPLHVMLERLGRVARREQVPELIELDSPRVAAPLG